MQKMLIIIFFILLPVTIFAQRKNMLGFSVESFGISTYNVPTSSGFSSYLSSPGIVLLGGIEVSTVDWDNFSYSVQLLLDLASGNYLELPILIKIPISNNVWKTYFFAGPMFGFKISRFHRLGDLAIYFGIGFSHYLNDESDIFFQLGYSHGILDISPPNVYDLGFGGTWYREYSRELHLNVGILFGK
jgi:hypothetical protein